MDFSFHEALRDLHPEEPGPIGWTFEIASAPDGERRGDDSSTHRDGRDRVRRAAAYQFECEDVRSIKTTRRRRRRPRKDERIVHATPFLGLLMRPA